MYERFKDHLLAELAKVRAEGLYKEERILTTSQGVEIKTDAGLCVLNFCANNYLGLSSNPDVIRRARRALRARAG